MLVLGMKFDRLGFESQAFVAGSAAHVAGVAVYPIIKINTIANCHTMMRLITSFPSASFFFLTIVFSSADRKLDFNIQE